MKRTIFALLTILILTLSACSGQAPAANSSPTQPTEQASVATDAPAQATTVSSQDSSAATTLNTSYDNAVPVAAQLLIGTLKLVGTDQAVTKEQAALLIPLWTNLQTLSSQNMGAMPGQGGQDQQATPQPQATNAETQSQIEAIAQQIQAAMTPAQIQAIAEMKITQETVMAVMQASGASMGVPQQQGGNGNMPQPPQDGTPPAGGPGGNSDQPPSGEPPSKDGRQSGNGQQPGQPPSGDGMQVPPQLIETLIQTLQKIQNGEMVTPIAASSTNSNNSEGGNPPSGPGSTGDASSGLSTATGAYTLDGGSTTQADQTYTATNQDQSGVYVLNSGILTLNNATVNTSGDTSSDDKSSFYGLNAGVLAASSGTITMNGGTITTSGRGANGAFATGELSVVNLSNVTITATGDGGHGVMATQGGAMALENVDMTTSGAHSAPIATDRGGGTIVATGGTLNTSGQDSPCYYSTGTLKITNSVCNALGSEIAVIEGANSVELKDSTTISKVANKWAVMIYQSFSGDALGSDGIFTMTGGSLAYTDASGPLFYITNTHGTLTLSGVEVSAASGILLKAEGNDRWGTSGANGGTVDFTADAQTLSGNFLLDALSSLNLILQNGSTLTGAINPENTAQAANLTLDASSAWNVTADSHLTCLTGATFSGTQASNITGNGHTVYYNAASCPALNGQTYTLNGGGSLTPAK